MPAAARQTCQGAVWINEGSCHTYIAVKLLKDRNVSRVTSGGISPEKHHRENCKDFVSSIHLNLVESLPSFYLKLGHWQASISLL